MNSSNFNRVWNKVSYKQAIKESRLVAEMDSQEEEEDDEFGLGEEVEVLEQVRRAGFHERGPGKIVRMHFDGTFDVRLHVGHRVERRVRPEYLRRPDTDHDQPFWEVPRLVSPRVQVEGEDFVGPVRPPRTRDSLLQEQVQELQDLQARHQALVALCNRVAVPAQIDRPRIIPTAPGIYFRSSPWFRHCIAQLELRLEEVRGAPREVTELMEEEEEGQAEESCRQLQELFATTDYVEVMEEESEVEVEFLRVVQHEVIVLDG